MWDEVGWELKRSCSLSSWCLDSVVRGLVNEGNLGGKRTGTFLGFDRKREMSWKEMMVEMR